MLNIVGKENLVDFYLRKMFTEIEAAAELYGVDEETIAEQFFDAFGDGFWDLYEDWQRR